MLNSELQCQRGVTDTLRQVFKEALADCEQRPVVVLEDGCGGHKQLSVGIYFRHFFQTLCQPTDFVSIIRA